MNHRSRILQAATLFALIAGGVLVRAAVPEGSVDPLAELSANSCAIKCPADAPAYSGMGGAVGCESGYVPVCQCSDASQKLAYCASLSPKP